MHSPEATRMYAMSQIWLRRILGSHNDRYEELCSYLLGYNILQSVKINQRFGRAYRFHLQGRRTSQAINQPVTDIKKCVFTRRGEGVYSLPWLLQCSFFDSIFIEVLMFSRYLGRHVRWQMSNLDRNQTLAIRAYFYPEWLYYSRAGITQSV
jgi:hypothetical protein